MLVLLVGTGIFLTIRLRGLQFHGLLHSLYLALVKRKEENATEGDISHFQALMTALAATVGTGNIAGVATAIASGGPGALFWMWITGLFGMATKYAEAVLAIKYREVDEFGTMSGGPMYYLSKGLGAKWLGVIFAVFASVSAFGIGNIVQSNSVAEAVRTSFPVVPTWAVGAVMAVATALVLLRGIKSIGRVASLLVPVVIVFYMLGATAVVILNYRGVPSVFSLVVKGAFTGTAMFGGFLGASVREAIRWGVARGVFSNESGLGSAPIAAAAAQTRNPVTQALVSMTQTFIDTIVVCSFTGFVIISTGLWSSGKTGAELTTLAFNHGLPGNSGGMIVAIGLILFAYSTIIGWSYYGEKSLEYLLGPASVRPYRALFCVMVFVGSVISKLELVWSFADVMNGLMALPNLVGLLGLSGVVVAETKKYYWSERAGLR
ncbi:MAG: sodium:alanine symporter family protein [bacterium]|jgi:AGCS family alanine or glycine:cation symporter|nr:sodium:alanine symporter family protein [candidate division KSB1 bacterium]MDH7559684.1 sodium:alanine symporter family protein [bacterium]